MPADPDSDPFAPPKVNTEVGCLHCGEVYDSYRIEWRMERNADGVERGFWCCPISGCDGKGFGFDIFPTDPNYQDEHGGWIQDDETGEDDWDEAWDEELSPDAAVTDDEIPLDDVAKSSEGDPPQPPRDDWPFSMN